MIRLRIMPAAERRAKADQRVQRWHKWFAWKPVRLTSDHYEVRFLCFVYRRGRKYWHQDGHSWEWTYADNEFDMLKINNAHEFTHDTGAGQTDQ